MNLAERIRGPLHGAPPARRRLPDRPGPPQRHPRGPRPTAPVKAGFVLPFRERPVVPSFDRPNVTDPAALEEAIAQAKKSLRLVVRNGRPAHPRALRPGLRPGRRFVPRLRQGAGRLHPLAHRQADAAHPRRRPDRLRRRRRGGAPARSSWPWPGRWSSGSTRPCSRRPGSSRSSSPCPP
ncbi:MAG: hypothetical protein M0C28_15410 [Candidatus Moduliflexus flocculans]|nr:hypothetical protein [Candidatus Moduliflexus flocculans]